MKNKIKTGLAILLAIAITFQYSSVFAVETKDIAEFNLKTAIDTALTNSSSLKLYDDKIKNAADICIRYNELAIVSSNASPLTNEQLQMTTDLYFIEKKKTEELYPAQKENDLRNLRYEKENKIIDIKLDVTENYFTLLSLEKQISCQNELIKRLEEDLEVKKSDVKLGRSVQSVVTEIELSIKKAGSELVQLNREEEKSKMALNSLLGRQITDDIEIIDIEVPEVNYDEIDIKAVIEDRQKNNNKIKDIRFQIEQAKLEAEIVEDNTSREDPVELDALKDTQLEQEYALKDEMISIEKYIYQENNTILNLKDEIEIKELNKEICDKNLEIAQQKLKLGLLSGSAINTVINAAEQANIDYMMAKLDYYLEVQKFNAYMEKQ
ncbi:outer membrane efflux protein [Ruminiclostridium sufflavum DSM 19573]|uniref:Outer membrane efflux protein n=1 Tax=Ruminiclostridium sufflavum DSM 19573 TaxID=1121337 RepID=A0A318XL30_9FIRM|nr:TolC family protein [Ruminiclostridium sufflavum]PYG87158.1 outer membrane efflux protein [Ruminiclostridium sufflavum DSM 19573]